MSERPSLGWRALLGLLWCLPQGPLSRVTGWVADRRLPRAIQGRLNRGFARTVGIAIEDSQREPEEYPSLGAFFTRALKDGVRSWPEDRAALASPVDGVVGAFGSICEDTAIQAKGLDYSVSAMLGEIDAGSFEGGQFLTIYLSPRHYHRIHTPCAGVLEAARHVVGRLFPVNRAAVLGVPRLFVRNERLVMTLRHRSGAELAMVAVGATNVGRIRATFDEIVTNRGGRGGPRSYQPSIELAADDHLATFELGSTVVLLLSPSLALDDRLESGQDLLVGQVIGNVRAAA